MRAATSRSGAARSSSTYRAPRVRLRNTHGYFIDEYTTATASSGKQQQVAARPVVRSADSCTPSQDTETQGPNMAGDAGQVWTDLARLMTTMSAASSDSNSISHWPDGRPSGFRTTCRPSHRQMCICRGLSINIFHVRCLLRFEGAERSV